MNIENRTERQSACGNENTRENVLLERAIKDTYKEVLPGSQMHLALLDVISHKTEEDQIQYSLNSLMAAIKGNDLALRLLSESNLRRAEFKLAMIELRKTDRSINPEYLKGWEGATELYNDLEDAYKQDGDEKHSIYDLLDEFFSDLAEDITRQTLKHV